MQLGVVGLGRMGANIVRRLKRNGHACVVYDVNAGGGARAGRRGRQRQPSLEDLVAKLDAARGLGHAAGRRGHRADGACDSPSCSSPATW